jgi:hypothetical protein
MTTPWLMNCPHDGSGWCLDCVRKLAEERNALQDTVDKLPKTADGIPVVPFVDHVYHPGAPRNADGIPAALLVSSLGFAQWWNYPKERWPIHESYSSRKALAAAESAKAHQ